MDQSQLDSGRQGSYRRWIWSSPERKPQNGIRQVYETRNQQYCPDTNCYLITKRWTGSRLHSLRSFDPYPTPRLFSVPESFLLVTRTS